MANFLDESGLLYFWNTLKAKFATKAESVTNITRSGTTFTATRADGTTFTFDQQQTGSSANEYGTIVIGNQSATASQAEDTFTVELGSGLAASAGSSGDVTIDTTYSGLNTAFSISSFVVANGDSITSGGQISGHLSIGKTGYFPLGVVGYTCSSRYGVPTAFYLTNAAVGSATLNWMIYNPSGSTRSPVCTMYVLWVKAT